MRGYDAATPLSRSSRTCEHASEFDPRLKKQAGGIVSTRDKHNPAFFSLLACCQRNLAPIELTVPSRTPAPRTACSPSGESKHDPAWRRLGRLGSCIHLTMPSSHLGVKTRWIAGSGYETRDKLSLLLSHPSPVPKTPVKGLQRPFAIGVYFQPVSHPGYYSGCHSR